MGGFLDSAFGEMALVLGITVLCAGVGLLLRQPLIIAFLFVGIAVGPSGLHLIESYERLEVFAHIGIALLLFVVGLRLDLHLIRTLGPVALATGIGQVLFTAGFGFLIAWGLGLGMIPSAYVAVALTFSSTIIIVKLLSDKGQIDSLHGRIAIGFLIIQDVVAIAAMIALVALGGAAAEESGWWYLLRLLGIGVGFLAALAVAMRWILPVVLRWVAKQQEFLVLFAIAWALLLSAVADTAGFSKEIGAFLAGVSLASTRYRDALGARLTTIRDFLLLFFFIVLGAGLEFSAIRSRIPEALLFSVFVLIGNPLIVMAIMGVMGYRKRTGFLAGLTVAQVSEFSLILAALGHDLGHLDEQDLGLVTVVGIVTICASTYLILSADTLYRWLEPVLGIFERREPFRERVADGGTVDRSYDVVLIGLGTYGSALFEQLHERRKQVLGIDFDPEILQRWQGAGADILYGDLADPGLIEQLPLQRSRWIVSTIRNRALNLRLLDQLRERGYQGLIALAARDEGDARALDEAGPDVVLRPFTDAAGQAADALTETARVLHLDVDWPVAIRELRLPSGSASAGAALHELPLSREMGVSVLAVSRAGRVEMALDPGFRIYPGDRIVLMGTPDDLRRAEAFLVRREAKEGAPGLAEFALGECELPGDSPAVGRSLAELALRERCGITVIGIGRGEERLVAPRADMRLQAGDRVIVVGTVDAVEAVREEGLR